MRELKEMAFRHGTDKCRNDQYLEVYDEYFSKIRKTASNVLEIGVKRSPPDDDSPGGKSLRLWKEYFDDAMIFGLDIDPENKKFEEDGIKIYIGNQGDHKFLREMMNDVLRDSEDCEFFDAILDDGSHVNELTLSSFKFLWKFVKSGGFYIIEDLGCSYIDLEKYGNVRNKSANNCDGSWWGMDLLDGVSYRNDRSVMDSFFLEKIRDLDFLYTREAFQRLVGSRPTDLKSIHFYSGICVLVKS
jgi:hypothetical protein